MATNSSERRKPHENKFLFEDTILQGPRQFLRINKTWRNRVASGFLSADGWNQYWPLAPYIPIEAPVDRQGEGENICFLGGTQYKTLIQ